jgi:hypothetical protein
LSLRVAAAGGLAAAGVFGGHVLTYALVVERHEHPLLVDVAHGYLPFAGLTVAVLGFVALLAGIASGYVGGGTPALWTVARRLALLQAAAFTALEVLERLAVGASLSDLAGPLLVVGLLVQLLAALLSALLLGGLRRVGQAIARTHARAIPSGVRRVIPSGNDFAPRRRPTPIAGRAPPEALAA